MSNFFSLRKTKKVTTRTQLFVGVISSVLIPSLLINLLYLSFQNSETKRQMDNYNRSVVEQAGEKLDILLDQIHVTNRQLIAGTISSENLKIPARLSAQERVNAYNRFSRSLLDIEMSLMYDAGIFLMGDTINVQSGNNTFYLDRAVADVKKEKHGVPVIANHFSNRQAIRVIPFITEIKNYTNILVDTIIIELYYSNLEEILKDVYLGDESEFFIINKDNVLIYYSGIAADKWKDRIGDIILQNTNQPESFFRTYNQYSYTTDKEQWKLIAYTNNQSISGDRSALTRYFIGSIVISVILAFVFSLVISRAVTRPINELIHKMRHFDDNSIADTEIKASNQDIQELSANFDQMRVRIAELMKSVAAKEKENSSIQLKMLQAQINPHFLYNTLEVMRSIALEHNVDSIEEISRHLAKMFRYSISKSNSYVKFSDELEHVKSYITIQKYRFGDRLQAVYSIDRDILDKQIVKFILQPIVENAILHGLDKTDGQGIITIIAMKHDEDIEIRVIDNGIGIQQEKLEQLREDLKNHNESSSGIGIANVEARLKLYYGLNYGFNIESFEGEGTQVTIRVPMEGTINV